MSVSVSRVIKPRVLGSERMTVTDVTLDSSFESGGEPLTAANLGLGRVDFAISTIKTVGGTVNVASAHYDTANGLLKVYDETPAEVSGDVSNVVVQVVAFGS